MWAQIINAMLGIWLMAAPAVLAYGGAANTNSRIVGPIAATFAITAMWSITRGTRWVNVVAGFWLLIAPWVLGYSQLAPRIDDRVVGFLLVIFALVRGEAKYLYGGGWASLFQKEPEHLKLSTTPESTYTKD
ncbi:MAG TPA: SPW repeat protein [Rhodothermales bacterium]|nr:SPW repeat protein [Rhodothermales bacterium]